MASAVSSSVVDGAGPSLAIGGTRGVVKPRASRLSSSCRSSAALRRARAVATNASSIRSRCRPLVEDIERPERAVLARPILWTPTRSPASGRDDRRTSAGSYDVELTDRRIRERRWHRSIADAPRRSPAVDFVLDEIHGPPWMTSLALALFVGDVTP